MGKRKRSVPRSEGQQKPGKGKTLKRPHLDNDNEIDDHQPEEVHLDLAPVPTSTPSPLNHAKVDLNLDCAENTQNMRETDWDLKATVDQKDGQVKATVVKPKEMNDFPNELLNHILGFLDIEGLRQARLVSNNWRTLATPILRQLRPIVKFKNPAKLLQFCKSLKNYDYKKRLNGGIPFSSFVFKMLPMRHRQTHRRFKRHYGQFTKELTLSFGHYHTLSTGARTKIYRFSLELLEELPSLTKLKLVGQFMNDDLHGLSDGTVQLPSLETFEADMYNDDLVMGEIIGRFVEGAVNLKRLILNCHGESLSTKLPHIIRALPPQNNTKVSLNMFALNEVRANVASLDYMNNLEKNHLKINALNFRIYDAEPEERRNFDRELEAFTKFLTIQGSNIESLGMIAYEIKNPNFNHVIPTLPVLKELKVCLNRYNKFQNFAPLMVGSFPCLRKVELRKYSESFERKLFLEGSSVFESVEEFSVQYKHSDEIMLTRWDQIFPNLKTLKLYKAKLLHLRSVFRHLTKLINLFIELDPEYEVNDFNKILSGFNFPSHKYNQFFEDVYKIPRIVKGGAFAIETDGLKGIKKLATFLSTEESNPGLRSMENLKVLHITYKNDAYIEEDLLDDCGACLSFFEIKPLHDLYIPISNMSDACKNLLRIYHCSPIDLKTSTDTEADNNT